jgi:hypothetical protein
MIALGLFMRDLEKAMNGNDTLWERDSEGRLRRVKGRRRLRWVEWSVCLAVRCSGCCAGAWLAGVAALASGFDDYEFLASGVGGLLGWRLLDVVSLAGERLTWVYLRELIQRRRPGGDV